MKRGEQKGARTCSTLCLVAHQNTYNYIDDAFMYTYFIPECEVILAC